MMRHVLACLLAVAACSGCDLCFDGNFSIVIDGVTWKVGGRTISDVDGLLIDNGYVNGVHNGWEGGSFALATLTIQNGPANPGATFMRQVTALLAGLRKANGVAVNKNAWMTALEMPIISDIVNYGLSVRDNPTLKLVSAPNLKVIVGHLYVGTDADTNVYIKSGSTDTSKMSVETISFPSLEIVTSDEYLYNQSDRSPGGCSSCPPTGMVNTSDRPLARYAFTFKGYGIWTTGYQKWPAATLTVDACADACTGLAGLAGGCVAFFHHKASGACYTYAAIPPTTSFSNHAQYKEYLSYEVNSGKCSPHVATCYMCIVATMACPGTCGL